tara:strand:- start:1123 stop:1557 length:435 start_codon:yes stop_codon:yes gene_type:complete
MLRDIQLVDFLEDTGAIRFHYPLGGQITEGTNNLIQLIVKRILTLRGSNPLEPTVGSNFYGLFGTIDYQEVDEIKETFPLLLDNLTETIISEQEEAINEGLSLTDDEKLVSLTMETVEYDVTFSGWLITIKIETASNQFFVVNL